MLQPGIFAGGAFGVIQGLRNSPSPQFGVRVNSVLNASGKGGSRAGNALGVLSVYYVSAEWCVDKLERELVGSFPLEVVNPIISGAIMGGLYKATKGPKTALLAAVIGSAACAGYHVAGNYVPSMAPSLAFLF
jgi:import inner membrane translocase subunit TIM23